MNIAGGPGASLTLDAAFEGTERGVERLRWFERFTGAEDRRGGYASRVPGAPAPRIPPVRRSGSVSLVGAGPGDPELLTVKAARLIAAADAIVYDHLVGAGILELARADAERIYVGKESGRHTLPQEQINALLVRLAREGKRVVRLKGGDPFIFGRGGEELEELTGHGIEFEVVPGITAAAGMAAYTGIPLTHRDHSQACVFVTGHLRDGSCDLDWEMLARPRQTVVIYMGVSALREICAKLTGHGLPASTPAAIVQHATTPRQRCLTGTLETLADLAGRGSVGPPALIVVGDVVRLSEKLAWFDRQAQAAQAVAG